MTREELLSMITAPDQDGGLILQRSLPRLAPSDFGCLLNGTDDLARLHPRHFESLVAELLKSDGYDEVHLIPRSNAPGPDVIALCRGPSGQKQEYIVECKRWREAVGLEVVRQVMYQVDIEKRATGAIIVTTSGFTRDAVEEVQRLHQWRLTLRDGEAVLDWVNKHATDARRDILSSRRLERLRSTYPGELFFSLISNPHVTQAVKLSQRSCDHCNGPVACGLASVGMDPELSLYPFHVCLLCLHVKCEELKELLSRCPYCDAPFDFYLDELEKSLALWDAYAKRQVGQVGMIYKEERRLLQLKRKQLQRLSRLWTDDESES